MALQYRRGGNRPITRRLLICWAQTAAVLPPMRNPRVYTASIYTSNSRSRIRSPSDSCWDIRSAMAFFIPPRALIRPASLFFAFFLPRYPLPTRCSDKTFLNWVSLEGDVPPVLLESAGFYFFDYLLISVRSFVQTRILSRVRLTHRVNIATSLFR